MAREPISRIRRVVLLLLCFSSLGYSYDLYILSYKTQVKNNQLIYQSLLASKAMMQVDKSIVKSTTILLSKQCLVKNFFNCYESEILDFLLKTDVYVQSIAKTQSLVATSFSELVIRPQYVQVEFNDTFVKMSLLK